MKTINGSLEARKGCLSLSASEEAGKNTPNFIFPSFPSVTNYTGSSAGL